MMKLYLKHVSAVTTRTEGGNGGWAKKQKAKTDPEKVWPRKGAMVSGKRKAKIRDSYPSPAEGHFTNWRILRAVPSVAAQ